MDRCVPRKLYKDMLLEVFRYCAKEKGLRIHAYVIMSNHVHMIISGDGRQKLEEIIRDMKKYSSYRLLKEIKENLTESRREWILFLFRKAGTANSNNKSFQLWKQDNHPLVLDDVNKLHRALDYVHNNPVEAGIVEKAEDYLYSSARDHYGMKGLVDITLVDTITEGI